ncbi:MAG: endopeptidase La [Kineothrix sp.]
MKNTDAIKEGLLPVVPLRGMTILPRMTIHFDLSREKSIAAVEQAMLEGQRVFLATQKAIEENDPGFDQVYHIGTIALVRQITRMPGHLIRVMVEGLARGELLYLTEKEQYLEGSVREIGEPLSLQGTPREKAMVEELKDLFSGYAGYYPKIGEALSRYMYEAHELGSFLDQMTINMPLSFEDKQRVLSAVDLEERYEAMADILSNEIEVAGIRTELTGKLKERVDRHQREYMLREQLQLIREELGEEDSFSDAAQYEADLKKLKAGKEIKEKIRKEISRFRNLPQSSSESAVERGYIETLLELPWDKRSRDNTDIARAEAVLEEDHYGLKQVKERVLETLAVRCMSKQGEAPVICLVGPPGTGKTSIARSVAKAMKKEYVRICLGGVRDEAEIRGHRKTYVGAMPGRIIKALKQAGVKNPLMLLDEIDKVSSDYKGDTSSALLEVLDGEQNERFRDHYVEIPVDLSEVLFIATANSTETIPRPLLDRMELIEVTSYTANEKFHIAKEHLVEKQMKKNGLDRGQLSISDGALKKMIEAYTREAGVRELERKLGRICRKAVKEILQSRESAERHETELPVKITDSNLEKYLGREKYSTNKANEKDEVGIVRGLAWTSVGGDTLQVEVNRMPGRGELELTGQMGDVMKESALIGLSYVRSVSREYKIAQDMFKKNDFHLHIPEGAVPKDGPSAGITMAAALLSAITMIPVKADLAMTGEITLRGRVLPVGGLKEKILAAKTAGISTVLVPGKNRKDVDEISDEIKDGLAIYFVDTMEEVLSHALVRESAEPAGIREKGGAV